MELDQRIAELMGDDLTQPIKPYSTDIAAAWLVAERLASKCAAVHVLTKRSGWACEISSGIDVTAYGYKGGAPMAICLAAIEAFETIAKYST